MRSRRFTVVFVASMSAYCASNRATAQCPTWLAGPFGSVTGINGPVLALTMWDPDGTGPLQPQLVAGGCFTTATGTTVNGIARWDGTAWHPMATTVMPRAGFANAYIYAMIVPPAGSGPISGHLIVAGHRRAFGVGEDH